MKTKLEPTTKIKEQKTQKVPKLRFSGFEGEWEEKRLGEIALFTKGRGIAKSDIVKGGGNKCIRYGELYTEYAEVINEVKSCTDASLKNALLSEKNDLLIPSSGESAIDIAKASCVSEAGVILGGDLNIVKLNDQDGVFFAYYLTNARKRKIAQLAQGNSVVHLYNSQLKSLSVNPPSLLEQQKIASFLSSVDNYIQNLKAQKEGLEAYKKGVMQKIFSQEIRFKDENGEEFSEWEEKRLGEVFSKRQDRNKKDKVKYVLTNSAVEGIVGQLDYFEKDIANQGNLTNYYIVNVDDFIYNPRISRSAPVGPLKRNKLQQGVMSPLYTVLKPELGNLTYLEKYFDSKFWHKYMYKIANYGARHDRMNILQNDFFKMTIPYPCISEQQKIADFLLSIDKQIEICQNRVRKMEEWKKGLMQGLFV